MRIDVLGVEFDDIDAAAAARAVIDRIAHGESGYAVTPNPEIVWLCRKDAQLNQAVNQADLVLADGIGILYGAKLLGRPLQARAPGIDFAQHLLRLLADAGRSVFLLGAKPGVAQKAAQQIEKQYPGIRVAGSCDGYFQDDQPVIQMINQHRPDFLMVCLGVPKQELWMQKHQHQLQVGFMAGLGGSIDVFAGVAARAPEGWRKAGFEWLYRLIKQPTRIKRAGRLPLFILAVLAQRISEMFKSK